MFKLNISVLLSFYPDWRCIYLRHCAISFDIQNRAYQFHYILKYGRKMSTNCQKKGQQRGLWPFKFYYFIFFYDNNDVSCLIINSFSIFCMHAFSILFFNHHLWWHKFIIRCEFEKRTSMHIVLRALFKINIPRV